MTHNPHRSMWLAGEGLKRAKPACLRQAVLDFPHMMWSGRPHRSAAWVRVCSTAPGSFSPACWLPPPSPPSSRVAPAPRLERTRQRLGVTFAAACIAALIAVAPFYLLAFGTGD